MRLLPLLLAAFAVSCDGDKTADDSVQESSGPCDEDGDGWCPSEGDCDDADADVHPGAEDICDARDNDCNGIIDDLGATRWYLDADGDGYGDADHSQLACDHLDGYVVNADDCDDGDAAVYLGAPEVCNGVDDDCDGETDEGVSTIWYTDADGDGYGDDASATTQCDEPGTGWVATGGDCDDTEPLAWTGATEVCDRVDNDCDGGVDDDAVDMVEEPADADGDGFGDPTVTELTCRVLVTNTDDCDDSAAREPQVVDAAATDTPDGSSAHPWPTIGEAMLAAHECVAVRPGTYDETLDFGGMDLAVVGLAGPADTIVDAGGEGSVVTFDSGEGAGAELRGFTLTGGTGTPEVTTSTRAESSIVTVTITTTRYYGGGVLIDGATPTLSDLHIVDNTLPVYSFTDVSETDERYVYSYGGGIFVTEGSGVAMDGVVVESNYADAGGGLYVTDSGAVDVTHGRFLWNSASDGGGVLLAGGTATLTNVILAGNVAAETGGGAVVDEGSSTWWNVTAVGGGAPTGGGVYVSGGAVLYLYSSTVTDTDEGPGVELDAASSLDAEWSNVWGNLDGSYVGVTDPTGTSGNISVYPRFARWSDNDTDDDDLTLAAGSSLIDAGTTDASRADADGSRNDVGAYGGPGSGW